MLFPAPMEPPNFFKDCVINGYINVEKFRKLCYTGIPPEERAFAYKVLLKVYSTDLYEHTDKDVQNYVLYKSLLVEDNSKTNLETNIDNSNNSSNNMYSNSFHSPTNFYFKFPIPEKTQHQIFIDIKRVSTKHRIFKDIDLSYVYMNILSISAAKRPKIGYVQGMCDLLIPFITIYMKEVIINDYNLNNSKIALLNAESHVYACFDALMDKIGHNICKMQDNLINRLKRLLKKRDKKVFDHFKNIDLDIHFFVFRWFNCLFIREFKMDEWFRIFDSMLSSEVDEFLVHFALSLIVSMRAQVVEMDFSEVVSCMQNLQEREIDVCDIITKAVFL